MTQSEYKMLQKDMIFLQEDIDRIYTKMQEQMSEMYGIADRLGDLWHSVVAFSEIKPDEEKK